MAKNNKYDAIERARNAAKQARDKNGRFIEMNGTMRYKSGGQTKSGTIIGVSGGYAYFLPPIKNKNHRPMPYRIPLNALEMYKPKATLKKKADRDHAKNYVNEQTKLFESKLDPTRKADQDTHKRVVDKAKKEKLDVDTYEVDKEGVEHLKKNDPTNADPKTQALINARLESLAEGESFKIPLEDGFEMEVTRVNGRISRKVLDSQGRTHSDRNFSEKKSDSEISQEIAKDVARENDTKDVGEEVQIDIDPEDIDGDGIPDISDPNVSPDWKTTTSTTKVTKEELDVAPKGAVIVSEDDNTIYAKSARRSESKGQQWNRYRKNGAHYELDRDDVYSQDIADGSGFKRPVERTSVTAKASPEVKKEKAETVKKQKTAKDAREQQLMDINDKKKHLSGADAPKGLLPIDSALLNLLPESAVRDKTKLDNVSMPKEELTTEILDSLPAGTQVSVIQRNGSISRVTKMSDGSWYAKKSFKDNLTGLDRHVLTSEEVQKGLEDDAKVRASTPTRRTNDLDEAVASREKNKRSYENNRTKHAQTKVDKEEEEARKNIEKATKNLLDEVKTVGQKSEYDDALKASTASNDDLVGTRYRLTAESGEEGTVYRKTADGRIENEDVANNPQDFFSDAKEFAEFFPQTLTSLMYNIDEDNVVEPDVKSSDVIEPLPATAESFPVGTKPPTPSKNQNKVKSGYHNYSTINPIDSITGLDGTVYELGETRTKRQAVIADMFKKGNLDLDDLIKNKGYKAMFEAEEGEETGRVYHDGTPIRIGDEILYRTALHENDVNSPEDYVEVRSVVIGRMNGKDDLLILPVEDVSGKRRQTKTGATITDTFGPENVLGLTNGTRNANLNKIRRTTDDGYELIGNRNPTNVDGRSGNFDLEDLYSQDGSVLGKKDRVQFRMQSSSRNTDGIPYNDVFTGRIKSVNRKNQSFVVIGDNGEIYRPSVKNTTSIDGPEPIPEPRIKDELDVPEGFRLDSQNRILTEESAQISEDVRDSLDQNRQTGTSPDSNTGNGEKPVDFGEVDESETGGNEYKPEETNVDTVGDAKAKSEDLFGESNDAPKDKPEPRKKRNLINSVVNTEQEYDSSIPRYFRDRKENEYGSDAEKATDWASAPVGSTIRLLGGGFAIKTSADSWDFRKSSKHLVQRRLSNKKFAETLVANSDFLENARTTAPTRKKFLEYNGGKLSPTAKPSSRKAPTGSEVEVEGDKLTKTESGWQGDQGVILSDKQLDKIMAENPEDVKVTKVSVSKTVSKDKSVAIQDSIFDLNEDGSFSRNDVFSFSPKETISAEEVDTVAGEMSPDFNMVVKNRNDNSEDSWEAVETVSLDSDGNIALTLDDTSEQTAKKVLSDFASRLEGSAVPPRRIILDESEHFQTVSAYSKPNPDGGYDLVVNPDGVEEKDIASALADGMRQNNATARGMSLRDYDKQVLDTLVSEEDRSLSYDEILKKLGIRSKRQGSSVAEAFQDVWENGEDASPAHLNIWKRYASDNEMIALFRKENGRDPVSDSELDKYRKKI